MTNHTTVTPEWISSKLKEHNITARHLSAQIGVYETAMSRYISGKQNMSGPTKAAIWWYFQWMEEYIS